jgi:AcrR family transcriptional regulator
MTAPPADQRGADDTGAARPESPAGRGRASRPRDSAASRQALLAAARSLFGQRGFDGTTLRDIGDRAGVDGALVARYFGSKADLYIAAVVAEVQAYQPPRDLEQLDEIVGALLELTDEQGLGPVTQALIRSDTADDIRAAARAHLARRLVTPLAAELTRQGTDRAGLRAEVVVAALLGVTLARALGWFDEVRTVPRPELVALLTAMFERESPAGS